MAVNVANSEAVAKLSRIYLPFNKHCGKAHGIAVINIL